MCLYHHKDSFSQFVGRVIFMISINHNLIRGTKRDLLDVRYGESMPLNLSFQIVYIDTSPLLHGGFEHKNLVPH